MVGLVAAWCTSGRDASDVGKQAVQFSGTLESPHGTTIFPLFMSLVIAFNIPPAVLILNFSICLRLKCEFSTARSYMLFPPCDSCSVSQGADSHANHNQQACHLVRDPVMLGCTLLLQGISYWNFEGYGL